MNCPQCKGLCYPHIDEDTHEKLNHCFICDREWTDSGKPPKGFRCKWTPLPLNNQQRQVMESWVKVAEMILAK